MVVVLVVHHSLRASFHAARASAIPADKNVFVVSHDMIQHSKAVFEPDILSDFSRESFSVHIIV
jgi:hypothetical protein